MVAITAMVNIKKEILSLKYVLYVPTLEKYEVYSFHTIKIRA